MSYITPKMIADVEYVRIWKQLKTSAFVRRRSWGKSRKVSAGSTAATRGSLVLDMSGI
jgi:hypothetical protein